jgi:hypothetical protein
MSNTWGSQTWSFNQWNDLNNVSLSVTGIPVSSNLGDETTAGEINSGWGRQEWNVQGWGIQGTLLATGNSLSSNLGSVTTTEEINVGWGSDTWGSETWGISGLNVDLTGIQLSSNIGTLSTTGDGSVDVTGEEATATEGNVEAFSSFVAEVTGIPMAMDLTFDPEIVSPLGQELTSSLGTATLDANTIAEVSTIVPSYYGSETWGFGAWGNEPIETLAMTSDEGTVDPSPDATVVGIGLSASLAVGSVAQGDANVDVLNPSEGGNGFSVNGDAQLSTAEKQFGTASLLVDGTGDYVNASGTVDGLDGGAFTIEFWWYASDATTQTGILWDGRNASGNGYSIGIDNGNLILYEDGAQLSSSSGLFSNNTWMHLAFARDASNNGALWSRGTRRNAIGGGLVNNNNSNRTFIGADLNGANAVSAYIDEYRQSNIARYNPVTEATITVPTSEFSIDANTVNLLHFDGTNGSTTISNALPPSIAMTMTEDSVTIDLNTPVDLTGIAMPANLGSITEVTGTAVVNLTGFDLTMQLGTNTNILIWNQVDTGTAPVDPPGWVEVAA